MKNFRNINYGRLLLDTLTNYFSVNVNGNISWMFKFCLACLAPLALAFQDFVSFRNREYLIAQCKFQIGQLTNLLNYFYDPQFKRITINQSSTLHIGLTTFEYTASHTAGEYFGAGTALQLAAYFGDAINSSDVTINVPVAANADIFDLTAVVNQIRIEGIPVQIVVS